KFPRSITHEKQLMNANEETKVFFEILEILYAGDRLGPTFLQLPPSFAGNHFPVLATYLRDISLEFPLAVEVRHSDYFDHGQFENSLNDLLVRLQVDRVIFDSRALFSAPPSDEHEEEAQRRKPNSPLRQIVTGRHPLLRFVGRNDVEASMPWVQEWAPVVAEWIKAGLTPYVFTHTPHDFHAPQLARAFHQELSKWLVELPNLPSWLGERESENSPQTRQLELF
ncbi:MAG: DUF72 domain-containing protein, partial [Planctomycetes bacterium]|nr:DUF72 domain-containing protein [Planctomycetota bacterium]